MPILLMLLSQMMAPTVAGALTSAGLSSGLASALAAPVISGLGTWAATGDAKKGLETGLLTGLGGALMKGLGGGAEKAATAAANPQAAVAANSPDLTKIITGQAQAAAPAQVAQPGNLTDFISQHMANAPTAAAQQGGGMNPMLLGLGASMLPSLLGSARRSGSNTGDTTPPYQPASPLPRHIVNYPTKNHNGSAPTNAATYNANDHTLDDTIWRYGQNGGEHMWFDQVPNSNRYILPNQNNGTTINLPGLPPVVIPPGGIGGPGSVFNSALGSLVGAQNQSVDGQNVGVNPAEMLGLQGLFSNNGSTENNMTGEDLFGWHLPRNRAGGGSIRGPGTATSDSIPAMLSDGEFVVPTDVVNGLGGGSNGAGAQQLSDLMQKVRLESMKQTSPRSMNLKVNPGK